MVVRYSSPPNWPKPPEGWVPPRRMRADPAWGPAPPGWNFWVDENGNPAPPPGPGQQGGAPTGPAAQGPNEKNWFVRHKLPTALVAILALIVVTVALARGGGGDGAETAGPGSAPATTTSQAADDQPAEQPTQEEPQAPGLKDPVVSGDLEFTVNSIKCGIRKVGPSGFEDRPQGQFCRLNIRVENIGDEEQQ